MYILLYIFMYVYLFFFSVKLKHIARIVFPCWHFSRCKSVPNAKLWVVAENNKACTIILPVDVRELGKKKKNDSWQEK